MHYDLDYNYVFVILNDTLFDFDDSIVSLEDAGKPSIVIQQVSLHQAHKVHSGFSFTGYLSAVVVALLSQ